MSTYIPPSNVITPKDPRWPDWCRLMDQAQVILTAVHAMGGIIETRPKGSLGEIRLAQQALAPAVEVLKRFVPGGEAEGNRESPE